MVIFDWYDNEKEKESINNKKSLCNYWICQEGLNDHKMEQEGILTIRSHLLNSIPSSLNNLIHNISAKLGLIFTEPSRKLANGILRYTKASNQTQSSTSPVGSPKLP